MDLVERHVRALAVDELKELGAGHQSRVFRVIGRDGVPAAAKVLDKSIVDRAELDARLDVTAALADFDPRVCRPLLIGGQRVTELISANGQQRCIVCFELAAGRAPDPAQAADTPTRDPHVFALLASDPSVFRGGLPSGDPLTVTAPDVQVGDRR